MAEDETAPAPAAPAAPAPRAAPAAPAAPKPRVDPDLPKEGGPVPPMTAFDSAAQANYHLDSAGNRIAHQVPEGYAFNSEGELIPLVKEAGRG